MKGSRVIEIIIENLHRISPRADGNYRGSDLMWALEEARKQAQEEESE